MLAEILGKHREKNYHHHLIFKPEHIMVKEEALFFLTSLFILG
jgi:hypothetical protein